MDTRSLYERIDALETAVEEVRRMVSRLSSAVDEGKPHLAPEAPAGISDSTVPAPEAPSTIVIASTGPMEIALPSQPQVNAGIACPHCGAKNSPDQTYCKWCERPLSAPTVLQIQAPPQEVVNSAGIEPAAEADAGEGESQPAPE